jgi:hypothetical protein
MADFLPQASATGHGHETNSLVVKSLIVFAVVLVGMGIVVEFCVVYVMRDFSQEETVLKALAPPAFTDETGPFPAPRLQAEPPVDLVRFKEAELRRLTAYGWVDRKAGIAHIPIDRAIAIVASSGLPAGETAAESSGAVTPASSSAPAAAKPSGSSPGQDGKP